jgi:hypothetical protein
LQISQCILQHLIFQSSFGFSNIVSDKDFAHEFVFRVARCELRVNI